MGTVVDVNLRLIRLLIEGLLHAKIMSDSKRVNNVHSSHENEHLK